MWCVDKSFLSSVSCNRWHNCAIAISNTPLSRTGALRYKSPKLRAFQDMSHCAGIELFFVFLLWLASKHLHCMVAVISTCFMASTSLAGVLQQSSQACFLYPLQRTNINVTTGGGVTASNICQYHTGCGRPRRTGSEAKNGQLNYVTTVFPKWRIKFCYNYFYGSISAFRKYLLRILYTV